MVKRVILIGAILGTLLSAGRILLSHKTDEPSPAKLAAVERYDVHQVAALNGRLTFAEEEYLYAPDSGVIKRICVEKGQRVTDGELLLCLETDKRDSAFSSLYENVPDRALSAFSTYTDMKSPLKSCVLRAEKTCTVRQLLAEEGSAVAAGMPLLRVSSHQQQIMCSAATRDAEKCEAGMWAWLSAEGKELGTAVIHEINGPIVDAATGRSMVQVALTPEGHIDLPEGAAVDVQVFLAGSDDVLSLPVEAITDRGTVWWVHEGRCTEIPAQIVLCDEMRAWVNLPEGMNVAIGEFKEGQRIIEAVP